jgi:ferric-dicitrate binding protein FerR (iron transport regulator)
MPESDSDSDLLNSLIDRMQEGMADRLDRQMYEAERIKAQEEAASQSRLEEMWMREHERQRAIAEAKAEQRRQEQMLVRYALIGVAIIILVVIVLALVLSQLGGETAPASLPLLLSAYA